MGSREFRVGSLVRILLEFGFVAPGLALVRGVAERGDGSSPPGSKGVLRPLSLLSILISCLWLCFSLRLRITKKVRLFQVS